MTDDAVDLGASIAARVREKIIEEYQELRELAASSPLSPASQQRLAVLEEIVRSFPPEVPPKPAKKRHRKEPLSRSLKWHISFARNRLKEAQEAIGRGGPLPHDDLLPLSRKILQIWIDIGAAIEALDSAPDLLAHPNIADFDEPGQWGHS